VKEGYPAPGSTQDRIEFRAEDVLPGASSPRPPEEDLVGALLFEDAQDGLRHVPAHDSSRSEVHAERCGKFLCTLKKLVLSLDTFALEAEVLFQGCLLGYLQDAQSDDLGQPCLRMRVCTGGGDLKQSLLCIRTRHRHHDVGYRKEGILKSGS
jgi:hypothetical protein